MSTVDYDNQRPWSDRFLLQNKKILAGVFGCDISLIDTTLPMIDMERAADLVIAPDVSGEDSVYVAVRTRTGGYADKYAEEFTIRAHYTEGFKTEYEKIMEGYGDVMLYGFVKNDSIVRWILLDLDKFREEAEQDYILKHHKNNKDGRNSFYAYNINSFNKIESWYPDILIAWSDGYFTETQITNMKENFYGT